VKFILLAVLIVAVVWMLRRGRAPVSTAQPSPPRKLPEGEAMVACAQCGIHLPDSEALPGRGGVFCSEAHRLTYEQARDRGHDSDAASR
jgi:uncharacterized protein